MTTEKQEQVNDLLRKMEETIREEGVLPLYSAYEFLKLGFSISERFREMEQSRDKWKAKAQNKE